jgi:hypothetical protein
MAVFLESKARKYQYQVYMLVLLRTFDRSRTLATSAFIDVIGTIKVKPDRHNIIFGTENGFGKSDDPTATKYQNYNIYL